MALLTYPKSDYLLNASIESLHIESREWLAELNLWRDEIAFLYKLTQKNEVMKNIPPQEVSNIEQTLVKVNNENLENLLNKVQNHELALAELYESNTLQEEEAFREKHKVILNDIYSTQKTIRALKKQFFSLVQQYG